MSAMITIQKKFLKLGMTGPNTLKVVSAPTTNTESRDKSSIPRSSPYTVCLPTIGSETDYYDSRTISYTG